MMNATEQSSFGGKDMSQKIENAREKLMTSGRNFLLRNRDGKNGKFSVRDLTTECDMALGTFYRYFQSKDDLVRQILSEEWDKMIDSLDPIMQSDTTLFEKVRGIYEQIDEFESNYRFSAMGLLNSSAESLSFREQNMRKMYDKIEAFLQQEIDCGRLVLSADLKSASYLLVQLFISTGRNPAMSFEDLWACMTFRDTSC